MKMKMKMRWLRRQGKRKENMVNKQMVRIIFDGAVDSVVGSAIETDCADSKRKKTCWFY